MNYDDDFRISSGDGTARAVFEHNILPLDEALGTTAERAAYTEANEAGGALAETHREALRQWVRDNPERDFAGDRDSWIMARDVACRPLAADIPAATAKSIATLKALRGAQQTALRTKGVRARLAVRYLEVDKLALETLTAWDAAFVEREALGRLIVRGDGSDVAGRGHWTRSAALGTSLDLNAEGPRKAAAIITRIAPRATVAGLIDKA